MRTVLLRYSLVMALVLALLYAYARLPEPLLLAGQPLEQATTKPLATPSGNATPTPLPNKRRQMVDSAAAPPLSPVHPEAKLDTAKKRILLIGDSMMEGLMFRMKDYTESNFHELQPVVWYGSSTLLWGNCDTLAHFIRKYKPDYVIIVLGGNELFIRGVEKRRPQIEHILAQVGKIPYLWVGPPNWKKDTGINDLIKNTVAKGAYYPSLNLKLARRKDGAHPTRVASAIWMDSLAVFMRSPQSAHPIRMALPDTPTKATPKAILLRMPQ